MEQEHSAALAPRLARSRRVLAETAGEMRRSLEEQDPARNDWTVSFCMEATLCAERRLGQVRSMEDIPRIVPPIILVLRAASSRLAAPLPGCSRALSELAIHLGSAALDSAILSGGRLDLRRCGPESADMLDEAKLITHSKSRERQSNMTPQV